MRNIGPSFTWKMRRNFVTSHDQFKLACKKPKVANVEKKKAKKNIYTTKVGDRKGKVFV